MDKNTILSKLKTLQPKYEKEGLLLLGIFGSYARDEHVEASDIDILIETTPQFLEKHKGFRAFAKLDDIKQELQTVFSKPIDLVDKVGLKQHKNTYILENTLYVS